MDDKLEYSGTTGTVSRDAGCLPETVRKYADEGLIESKRLQNGSRVFRSDAAKQVRQILAQRKGRGAA